MNAQGQKRTFRETIQHYNDLRDVVYEFAEQEFASLGAEFTEISFQDAVKADNWRWTESKRQPIWLWKQMYRNYHSNAGIKRFDVAVKSNGELCALCYGVPNKRKLVLKLHLLSRKPDNNPFSGKIFSMVLYAADAYARLIGADEMWLCNPMNEELVDYYQQAGFTPHSNKLGRTTHLSLRINK